MHVGETYIPYNLTGELRGFRWLLCRPLQQLSQGAKLMFLRLADYAGQNGRCFPSAETLADDLGVGLRAARGYITELREAGLIATRHTGRSASFTFLVHPWMLSSSTADNREMCTNLHSRGAETCTAEVHKSAQQESSSAQICTADRQESAQQMCRSVPHSLVTSQGTISEKNVRTAAQSLEATVPPSRVKSHREKATDFCALPEVASVRFRWNAEMGTPREQFAEWVTTAFEQGAELTAAQLLEAEKHAERELASKGKKTKTVSWLLNSFKAVVKGDYANTTQAATVPLASTAPTERELQRHREATREIAEIEARKAAEAAKTPEQRAAEDRKRKETMLRGWVEDNPTLARDMAFTWGMQDTLAALRAGAGAGVSVQ